MAIGGSTNGEFERKLWNAAEQLRGPVDPSEYKDYVLGLLFLKSMSDAFEERRRELEEKTREPESDYYVGDDEDEREFILTNPDEYRRENVFYIPEEARWEHLVDNATDPQIGQTIDEAMRSVEEENPRLQRMLPKDFSRSTLPHNSLENLINLFADLDLSETDDNGDKRQDEDIFGRVYEFFIKKFAIEGGQKGGEFYTPKCVVELLVEILEPYEGRVFDPFSGSGGMFVQSHEFLQSHGGDTDKISIYGQEINESTWRLCMMNLYLRGIDGNIKLGDSIRDDLHKGLEADYIITNPPFNKENWGKENIAADDSRFNYGMPPSNNANFAFIQHMIHHLADDGMAATIMANGSLSVQGVEGEIRKNIIEDDLLDAVITLPEELFYTTPIPVCVWVLSKGKNSDAYRDREGETLFIDASNHYKEVDRTLNIMDESHINEISNTVRAYRGEEGVDDYEDVIGFCAVKHIDEISDHDWVVTPGRFVGLQDEDIEGEPFEVKMKRLTNELSEQLERSASLESEIRNNLENLGYEF